MVWTSNREAVLERAGRRAVSGRGLRIVSSSVAEGVRKHRHDNPIVV